MTSVWLIRHGESAGNAGYPIDTYADMPLTTKGTCQAAAVSTLFPRPPSLIVSSPYRRARQSALPTVERFRRSTLDVWPVQEFTYLPECCYTGRPGPLRRRHSDEYWQTCDHRRITGVGAESFSGFCTRIAEMVDRLARLDVPFVAVFTHAHVIRTFMWAASHAGVLPTMAEYRSYRLIRTVPNGTVVPATVDGKGPSLSAPPSRCP